MEEIVKLTAKQARVLEIMRAENRPMFPAEIAEQDTVLFEKGAKSVSPLMNGLFKNGYVTKEKASCQTVDKDGNSVTKELMQYTLTKAGVELVFEIKA